MPQLAPAPDMTSKERVQRFHTDNVCHYPDLGSAFVWLPSKFIFIRHFDILCGSPLCTLYLRPQRVLVLVTTLESPSSTGTLPATGTVSASNWRPLWEGSSSFCPKWRISGPWFNDKRGQHNPSSPCPFPWYPVVCNKRWGENPLFSYLIMRSPTLSSLKATTSPAVKEVRKLISPTINWPSPHLSLAPANIESNR